MLCAGQVYRTSITVTGESGTAEDPDTITVAVTKPDGTAVAPALSPTKTATGCYYADYTFPSAGVYKFTWATTGPATAPAPDYVTVADYISVISVAEARQFLGAQGVTDDQLQDVCMAATLLAETVAGTIVTRAFTDVLPGRHAHRLVLPHGPLPADDSVTSVTDADGDQTWAAADLITEPAAGRIRRADRRPFTGGPWTTVYTGGRTVVRGLIVQGVKEILWDLWATQRGLTTDSDAPALAEAAAFEQAMAIPGGLPGYRIPPRALAYLQPERPLVTGFA